MKRHHGVVHTEELGHKLQSAREAHMNHTSGEIRSSGVHCAPTRVSQVGIPLVHGVYSPLHFQVLADREACALCHFMRGSDKQHVVGLFDHGDIPAKASLSFGSTRVAVWRNAQNSVNHDLHLSFEPPILIHTFIDNCSNYHSVKRMLNFVQY